MSGSKTPSWTNNFALSRSCMLPVRSTLIGPKRAADDRLSVKRQPKRSSKAIRVEVLRLKR